MCRFKSALSLALFAAISSAASASCFAATARGSFERTLNVTGAVDLEVTTGSGDVTVRPGDSSKIHIRGKVQAHDDWSGNYRDAEERVRYVESHPPISQDGNHIRVGPLEDRELSRHVSIDYEITAPAETRLTSQSGSGDLTVEGIQGPVNAKTGSGDLKFHGLKGSVEVRTGSGDGQFDEIAADHVDIETGSGDMRLHNVRCGLHLRTGSGDIEAGGDPTGDWVVHTGSGGITLHLPPEKGFDLTSHTSSGDVKTSLPITVQGVFHEGRLEGKIRGGGFHLDLQAGSGDIRID